MTVKGELDWFCTFSNLIWLFLFSKSDNLGWFRLDIDGLQQFVYQLSIVLSSVLADGSCGSGAWYMMTCLVCFLCYGLPFCSFATSLMASFSVNLGLIGASLCLGSPMPWKDLLWSPKSVSNHILDIFTDTESSTDLIHFVVLVELTLVWP